MNKVYVLLKKAYVNSIGFPYFEIVPEPPQQLGFADKLATLEPGECVDVFKSVKTTQGVLVEIFRVSNFDGQAQQELLESFTMEK